jgi:peptide/nickel transport system substrate-binding protein
MKNLLKIFLQGFDKLKTAYSNLKTLNFSLLRKVFSLMGKTEKILLIGLLSIIVISFVWSIKNTYQAITTPAPGFGGSLTEGFLGQPVYLNPVLAYSNVDTSLNNLIYSGLYKYDAQGNLEPDLAESLPEISEDQKQYTIKLKPNIQWHNGKKFSADDVVFTISNLKNPEIKSPLKASWNSTTVEKLNDTTLKFTTKEISGPFVHNLTVPILPQHLWKKVPANAFAISDLNLKPIGTGPYRIQEIKKLPSGKIQAITFTTFTKYHGGKTKIETLIAKFYDTETDIENAIKSEQIQAFGYIPFENNLVVDVKKDNYTTLKLPMPQFQVLFFNFKNPILAERKIRLALAELTPQSDIVNQAWENQADLTDSFLSFYTNTTQPTDSHNLEQAHNLLESAGYSKDVATGQWMKNQKSLELNLYTNDFSPNQKTAEILTSAYTAFGIKTSLKILPSKQLADEVIKNRTFDLLVYGEKFGPDPDPFAFLHSSQKNAPGLNLSGFENSEADKLLTTAHASTNQTLRMEKYTLLSQLILEQKPLIFLAQTNYYYLINKNIKGVSINKLFDSAFRFLDTQNWYINETRVLK